MSDELTIEDIFERVHTGQWSLEEFSDWHDSELRDAYEAGEDDGIHSLGY